jgi:hypothetical protein
MLESFRALPYRRRRREDIVEPLRMNGRIRIDHMARSQEGAAHTTPFRTSAERTRATYPPAGWRQHPKAAFRPKDKTLASRIIKDNLLGNDS